MLVPWPRNCLKCEDNPAACHVNLYISDRSYLKLGPRIVLALSRIRPRERAPKQTIERRRLSDLRHFGVKPPNLGDAEHYALVACRVAIIQCPTQNTP